MRKNLLAEKEITFKRINEDLQNPHVMNFDLNKSKIVFFSDIHKGTKCKNDCFRNNETIFCVALDHYFRKGFTLVQLGDIEEGWGFKIKKSLRKYRDSVLKYEKKFIDPENGSNYFRVYGNHDMKWRKEENVNNILKPHLTDNPQTSLEVKPAIRIGDSIVALHGHQGSIESDQFWKVSKGVVRFVTSVVFRTFGRKKSSAAKNKMLRNSRDLLLNSWASENRKLLIAGHTHRFLFGKKQSFRSVLDEYLQLKENLDQDTGEIDDMKTRHRLQEVQNYLSDQARTFDPGLRESTFNDEYISQLEQAIREFNLNEYSYFNIGSGVYREGITCIEINEGSINLVFWPNNTYSSVSMYNTLEAGKIPEGYTKKTVFSENLKDILDKIENSG